MLSYIVYLYSKIVYIQVNFYLDGRYRLFGDKMLSLKWWQSCILFFLPNLVLCYDFLALLKIRSKTWQFLKGKPTNKKAC